MGDQTSCCASLLIFCIDSESGAVEECHVLCWILFCAGTRKEQGIIKNLPRGSEYNQTNCYRYNVVIVTICKK